MTTDNSQWFDRRLSIGNILTIATVLVGVIASWYGVKSELAMQEATIQREIIDRKDLQLRVELRLAKIEEERDDFRDRLTRIEVTMRQQGDTLDRILRAVESTGKVR